MSDEAFENWASGIIYNNQPLPDRGGIPYFLAQKAYTAGVVEGRKQAREAAEAEDLHDHTEHPQDIGYSNAIHDVLEAIDSLADAE